MSKCKKKNLGECAYCPEPATTEDHVPPRGMFAKSMPNKPWVPACESCNGDASKDDEYMHACRCFGGRTPVPTPPKWATSSCGRLVTRRRRGYRPKSAGRSRLSKTSRCSLEASTWPFRGNVSGRVTDKIVRGWWFKLTGTRLPEEHRIMRFLPGKRSERHPLYEINEAIIRKCPGHFFGDYAFTFQLAFCPNSRLTCWLLRFYKVFEIIAYTCRVEKNGDFQLLDLRTPFCTIDDIGGRPAF